MGFKDSPDLVTDITIAPRTYHRPEQEAEAEGHPDHGHALAAGGGGGHVGHDRRGQTHVAWNTVNINTELDTCHVSLQPPHLWTRPR